VDASSRKDESTNVGSNGTDPRIRDPSTRRFSQYSSQFHRRYICCLCHRNIVPTALAWLHPDMGPCCSNLRTLSGFPREIRTRRFTPRRPWGTSGWTLHIETFRRGAPLIMARSYFACIFLSVSVRFIGYLRRISAYNFQPSPLRLIGSLAGTCGSLESGLRKTLEYAVRH
jgi:hypothetical protein